MSRNTRSEFAAHAALAQGAESLQSTRDDWRQVLARRDARRAAVRNIKPAPAFTLAMMLQSIGAMAVSLVSYF